LSPSLVGLYHFAAQFVEAPGAFRTSQIPRDRRAGAVDLRILWIVSPIRCFQRITEQAKRWRVPLVEVPGSEFPERRDSVETLPGLL